MSILALLPIILQILPYVFQLVKIAEELFSGDPKSGAQKKTFVLSALETIFDGMQDVSTGGQKNTWNNLEAPVSKIIDGAASIYFGRKDKHQEGPAM